MVIVGLAPPGFVDVRPLPAEDLPDILARSDASEPRSFLLDDPAGPLYLQIDHNARQAGSAFILPYDAHFDLRLRVLRRLVRKLAGLPAGKPALGPILSPYRHHRLTLAIRALDGEIESASRREIGTILFPEQARRITTHEWKSSALRKKIGRLIRLAHAMRDGDYRHLLTGDFDHIRWG